MHRRLFRIAVSVFAMILVSDCGGSSPSVAPPSLPVFRPAQPLPSSSTLALRGKIKHVVVIVQENRSFDNLFYGFSGADTVTSGMTSTGGTVALQPISFLAPYDVSHEESDYLNAYDGGRMDGFDKENVGGLGGQGNSMTTGANSAPQYGYVPMSEREPYVKMASTYVLADRFFPSQIDSSFTAHQYLIAAQTGDVVDNPDVADVGL